MKIGEIKVGVEYGAVEKPTRNYGTMPRRVEVLEIVTEAQQVWLGGGYSSRQGSRNVRRVKIKFLDEPTSSRRYRDEIAGAEKGSTLVTEARFLVSPWKDLRREVHARIEREQREADAKATCDARLRALLPKAWKDEWIYVTSNTTHDNKIRVEAKLEGRVLERILELAEKGAALDG